MQVSPESIRGAAAFGVAGAIFVAAGSIAANTYTAALHAADAFGGWENLGIEGGLNVVLNSGLSLGSEVLGFVGLSCALFALIAKQWPQLAAACLVGAIAIWFNMENSDEFVMRQAQASATAKAKSGAEYKAAEADASRADKAKADAEATESADPAAIDREIAGLQADQDRARTDQRWRDARDLKDQIAAARTRKTAAESRTSAIAEAQRAGDEARRKMTELLRAARPSAADQDRATLIKWAVEIVKALGLVAFTLETAANPVPQTIAPRPRQPAGDDSRTPRISEHVPVEPKPARKAASGLSAEARRERQRGYTQKWRAKQRARAGA